jgi:uncharacterized Tic20 family protein
MQVNINITSFCTSSYFQLLIEFVFVSQVSVLAIFKLSHLNYVSLYVQIGQWTVFLVGMCNLASVLCRLLKAYDGIIYNINGTFWLMVVWVDNPIGEALVEHGYSFARLQSFGGSAPVSLSVW